MFLIPKSHKCYSCKCYKLCMLPPINIKVLQVSLLQSVNTYWGWIVPQFAIRMCHIILTLVALFLSLSTFLCIAQQPYIMTLTLQTKSHSHCLQVKRAGLHSCKHTETFCSVFCFTVWALYTVLWTMLGVSRCTSTVENWSQLLHHYALCFFFFFFGFCCFFFFTGNTATSWYCIKGFCGWLSDIDCGKPQGRRAHAGLGAPAASPSSACGLGCFLSAWSLADLGRPLSTPHKNITQTLTFLLDMWRSNSLLPSCYCPLMLCYPFSVSGEKTTLTVMGMILVSLGCSGIQWWNGADLATWGHGDLGISEWWNEWHLAHFEDDVGVQL